MKVYKGVNSRGEKVSWIEPRIVLWLDLHRMIDGLCSCYVRNGGEYHPSSMSADDILWDVQEEYLHYGENAVCTWAEQVGTQEEKKAREWAKGLILSAFPELGE